ncbi:MAG: ATP-binding protein, partial [Flavobacterium sp.]
MLGSIYSDIGMYYHDLNVLDSTYYYYIKAENVYKALGDPEKIAEMEFYQARLLFEKGLHMESEVKVSKVLHLLKDYPLNPIPFEANQLMAICMIERKDYSEAKVYFSRALALMQKDFSTNQILDQETLRLAIMMLYLNLSDVTYLLKDYKQAKEYALKGLTYVNDDTPALLSMALKGNIAMVNMSLDILAKRTRDIDSYMADIEQVYTKALEINNLLFANHQAMVMAELYLEAKDTVNAFKWAEQSYDLSKSRDIKVDQRIALEFLVTHKAYENNEQVKEMIRLTHILEEMDYSTRNRFARIAYETEKIETENVALKKLITILVISSILIIIALLLGVYIYRFRNKNREIRLIKSQQEINESIYELILEKGTIATEVKVAVQNKIAKDIHDGIVNGIFTIRFHLQQLNANEEELKNKLIVELQHLEWSTRDISHSLLDSKLYVNTNFVRLIEELVLLQKNAWHTVFSLEYDDDLDLDALSAVEKVNIYLIIREAIHNVNKYSEATHCVISFTADNEGIIIKVKDNGIGFDLNIKSEGMGLASIHQRAQSINANLVIYSEKGYGVEVSFTVNV